MHPKYLVYDRPNAMMFTIKNRFFRAIYHNLKHEPYMQVNRKIGTELFNPTHEMINGIIAKAIKYGFKK
jgi:hypothetical protein